ncbi:hypothetical protein EVAR_10052_1 [Eumeta japonica]|uniref:Uncharacterized protein n=1 Tax=Eumeta variegata TaxID=151549 RepID=A0A4C1TR75_EUMVA|nr:hypothetical protein EVAR_10052_1 [Eumeta japonica]
MKRRRGPQRSRAACRERRARPPQCGPDLGGTTRYNSARFSHELVNSGVLAHAAPSHSKSRYSPDRILISDSWEDELTRFRRL